MKQWTKRMFAVALAVLMLVAAFPVTALMETAEKSPVKTGEAVEKKSTKYYALVIGQTKYQSASQLPGCTNDKLAMQKMLKGLKGSWKVTAKSDLTANQMRSAIKSAFKKAGKNDVCLFYYSGHGVVASSSIYDDEWQGALCGVDGSYLLGGGLASELKKACKGKVIVLLDSCGSGGMVAYRGSAGKYDKIEDISDPRKFAEAINDSFAYFDDQAVKEAGEEKISELRDGKFVVLTACAYRQTSVELSTNSGYRFGLFTSCLLEAVGFDHQSKKFTGKAPCDSNGNKKLTWREVGNETYDLVEDWKYYLSGVDMVVCGYTKNENFVMFTRK